ncbi:B-cell antigen receptor complex-associated protein alpha chain isoform X2 [Ctenopharyngodon idella]|uniref:B-cell antigen receptor complex-associated protein alpha chain isoform X2 n=1 Tax=Ctenopharyngodon idella TaxID=7959 RepID=UPI002231CBD0|nr:B-cell antigen receptor complex-associated protein alpha chain isoform X2 [Ctenopharyngodon idella]
MEFRLVIFLCFWAEGLKLEADVPFQRVPVTHEAAIRCCYRWEMEHKVDWFKHVHAIKETESKIINDSDTVKMMKNETKGVKCNFLLLKSTQLNDTGLYQCKLHHSTLQTFTHGTFLQVYIPLQKSLNLSESVKNSIITAEGVLLLLFVLIPGIMLLCKSKTLNELSKKKGREEENIYEGLNLDECNSAYHQIQRSSQQGPYQDVASCGEDIQLEKP